MLQTEKPKLLCLDDEIHNLDALERIFRKKYNILKAIGGIEAIELLNQHKDIQIIISDQRMPGISGVEFLQKSLETHPDCIKILLTGYTDIESVIESVNKAQIYRYLTKPWDATDLANTVDQGYEKYQLKIDLKRKNKELEQALADLKELDQAKSNFMILINHELKTPLTTIMSFAGLLKETILTEEQVLFTDRINKSSEKLKKIVDDVLLIAKGELNLLTINRSTVDLEKIKNQFPLEVLQNMKLKNQRFVENLEFSDFQTDENLFKTAFYRTLHNASKFGLANSEIEFSSKKIGNRVILSLINSGPSISNAILKKIFQPFQMDENIMNHSVGMGLGLSICHIITKALDGNLVIENTDTGVRVEYSWTVDS